MKKERDVERHVSHSGECLCMLSQEVCERQTQYIGTGTILTRHFPPIAQHVPMNTPVDSHTTQSFWFYQVNLRNIFAVNH